MPVFEYLKISARNAGWFDRRIVKRHYAQKVGLPLDLRNPQRLHAKMCWMKLYGMTPLHSFCTDKIMAPAYIASILGPGHTPARFFATHDPADVDPSRIPSTACVVKANHDYDSVFLIPDMAGYDWEALRGKLRVRLARNFYQVKRERQYRAIRPGVVVEELLVPRGGGPLTEVKVFCFGGRAEFYSLIVEGVQNKQSRRAYLNRDWTVIDMNRLSKPFVQGTIPRPDCLDQMIAMSEALAQPFAFVRVDYYILDGRPVIGELTFTSSAGYDQYLPDEYELALGARLDHRRATIGWRHKLDAARAHAPEVVRLL